MSATIPSGVPKQVKLPTRKAAEIALRSLRVRLARSVLTLVTIVMAIAFLTNMWANNALEPVIRQALAAKQGLTLPPGEAGGSRTGWLIGLSLLVCMVGISNAMLMSVMERFREIGTMKCLGALDSFILKLFLLESTFLGAVGTLGGVLVGMLLTFGLFWKNYGSFMWGHIAWGELPLIIFGSFFIGIGITAAAAMYPAWSAARMEPISAMRVDV